MPCFFRVTFSEAYKSRKIPSLLDNKTLCSYRCMSNNIAGVTVLLRHASNLFYSVLNFNIKATPEVLIIYQKYLFKLIPKSISKFPKVWTNWKWRKLSRNHTFLFLFFLTLNSCKSNWWQNPKHAFILNY